MLKRISIPAAILALASIVQPVHAATAGACSITGFLYFSPGLGAGGRGSFSSLEPESASTTLQLENCLGADGNTMLDPSSIGSAVVSGTFGDLLPDSCALGAGAGYASYAVPSERGAIGHGGHFSLRRAALEVETGSQSGATATITSALTLQPVEGNCVQTPMTVAQVGGVVTFLRG